jgi:outer membrane immunogenic protein
MSGLCSKSLVGICLGFLSSLSPALAADVVRIVPTPPPVVAVAPAFTWTGCYVGGHVGWGWGKKRFDNPDFAIFAPIGESFDLAVNGLIAGGQVGCDRQFQNGVVLGFEGSGSWSNMKGSAANTFTVPGLITRDGTAEADVEWLASMTVRVGRALDRVLFYGKGGAAFVGDTYRYSGLTTCLTICIGPNPAPFDFNGEEVRIGWTLGAGVEWAIHSSWSAKLEYDYFDFGTRRVTFYDPNGFGILGPVGLPVDVTQRIQTIRLGLNYRF